METSTAHPWFETLRGLGVTLPGHRRVLLVDDEADNLDVLRLLLDEEYEIHVATNGHEALATLERVGEFGVIISDQRMRGMTGVALLTEFSRRAPDTVRMILTAYSDVEPIVAAVNEGSVYRFFLKPWNPHEMRAAVADGLWLYQSRAALERLVDLQGERKKALSETVERLRRTEAELVASERMTTMGRLTSGITHNIRNSLTVMMNLLEMVQQQPTETSVLWAAQKAFRKLGALINLVGDINSLARGELHKVVRLPVEVGPFVEQLLRLFRLEPQGHSRPVQVTIAAGARVLAMDPTKVRQATMALLRNAAQASPEGAGIELGITADAPTNTAIFEVRDNGGGMDASTVTRAAQPFFSAFEPRGLGLGLEIARVVAEGHGGRLELLSAPGSGTIARLHLTAIDPLADNP